MRYLSGALLAFALTACDDPAPAPEPDQPRQDAVIISIPATDWQAQADQAFQSGGAGWQQALTGFDQTPDQATLDTLRSSLQSWYNIFTGQYLLLASRACQLEQPAVLERMDTWPLYPGYLDALPQWPESGLISDPYLEMSRQSLRQQHGATDPAEASLGFAALFVVLNGTADSPKTLDAFQGDDDSVQRRRQYLKLAGEQLVADAGLLSISEPLTVDALHCGLAQTVTRASRDASGADEDGRFVPAAVKETRSRVLLSSLQSIPETTLNAWEQEAPGIADAIAAVEEKGTAPLVEWLGTP